MNTMTRKRTVPILALHHQFFARHTDVQALAGAHLGDQQGQLLVVEFLSVHREEVCVAREAPMSQYSENFTLNID
jgi:hypothetical protein